MTKGLYGRGAGFLVEGLCAFGLSVLCATFIRLNAYVH